MDIFLNKHIIKIKLYIEEGTGSEMADSEVTVCEGTDCEVTVRKRLFAGLLAGLACVC